MYRVFSPVISLGANSSVSSVITAALPPPPPKEKGPFPVSSKIALPGKVYKKDYS